MQSKKILTAGEPMGLFIAREEAPLEEVENFSASVAGAEFNVAVGLSRLGHRAGYLTKLGRDPFGGRILRVMGQNGIDTSLTTQTEARPTGFMLKSRTSQGDPDIFYYRRGSAASTLSPQDVRDLPLEEWDAIHLTGILPALSPECFEASLTLMERARKAGIPIFFDPNLRPQLWPDESVMIRQINRLAGMADYLLPGVKEGKILCGSDDPEQIGRFYLDRGARAAIIKTGAEGARVCTREGSFRVRAYPPRQIVDTVGAGDGFAVGVISGLMEGLDLAGAVQRGCAIGTLQIMNAGDNEGLPTRAGLEAFMAENHQA